MSTPQLSCGAELSHAAGLWAGHASVITATSGPIGTTAHFSTVTDSRRPTFESDRESLRTGHRQQSPLHYRNSPYRRGSHRPRPHRARPALQRLVTDHNAPESESQRASLVGEVRGNTAKWHSSCRSGDGSSSTLTINKDKPNSCFRGSEGRTLSGGPGNGLRALGDFDDRRSARRCNVPYRNGGITNRNLEPSRNESVGDWCT